MEAHKGDKSEAAQSDHAAVRSAASCNSRPRRGSCSGTRCGPTSWGSICQESACQDKQLRVEKQGSPIGSCASRCATASAAAPPPPALARQAFHEIARAAAACRSASSAASRRASSSLERAGNPMNERQRALVTLVKSRALFRGHQSRRRPRFLAAARSSPGLAQPPMRYSERAEQLSADGALARAAVAANAARARSDAAARTRATSAIARLWARALERHEPRPRPRRQRPARLPAGGRLRRRRSARRARRGRESRGARARPRGLARAGGGQCVAPRTHQSRYVTCQSVV